MRIDAATIALGLVLGAAGCNAYEPFRLTGFEQETFSNKADILFVIDNSASMQDEAEDLATNFVSFIEAFADDQPPQGNPSLSDDVGRLLEFLSDRAGNVNYRIGITNTETWTTQGDLLGRDPVLTPADEAVPRKFTQNLMCEAACIATPTSVEVNCPGGGQPSAATCADNEFGFREEPIEAVLMALCGAVDNPPDICFAPWWLGDREWLDQPPDGPDSGTTEPVEYFDESDVGKNGGWLRDNAVLLPVVITDEGDFSRRTSVNDPDPAPYPTLLQEFGRRITWAAIAPNLDCPGSTGDIQRATSRLRSMVERSNGRFVPLQELGDDGDCTPTLFADALTQIGELLRGVADTFPLASVPIPETIVVEVDGQPIDEATCEPDPELGFVVCDSGWTYDPGTNAVLLKGSAVPTEDDAQVRIWYLPATGVPRDLPF